MAIHILERYVCKLSSVVVIIKREKRFHIENLMIYYRRARVRTFTSLLHVKETFCINLHIQLVKNVSIVQK